MENTQTAETPASGIVLIITAPSGAGKSSLVEALVRQDSDIAISISHTTRNPRPGDVDGRQYHFIDEADFLQKQQRGDFLEWAHVHGNYYGTSRQTILERVKAGYDTVLEIDWQGAAQIRQLLPEAVSVFILPPSMEVLEERLKKRGQDSLEVIKKRLQVAKAEISQAKSFDYVIINDDFELALSQLVSIVRAARCTRARQFARHAALFEHFGIASVTG